MEASEDAWSSIREWQAGLPAACQEVAKSAASNRDPSEWTFDRRTAAAKASSPLPPLPPKDTSPRENPATSLNSLQLLNRQQSPLGSSVALTTSSGLSTTPQSFQPKTQIARSTNAGSTNQQTGEILSAEYSPQMISIESEHSLMKPPQYLL